MVSKKRSDQKRYVYIGLWANGKMRSLSFAKKHDAEGELKFDKQLGSCYMCILDAEECYQKIKEEGDIGKYGTI